LQDFFCQPLLCGIIHVGSFDASAKPIIDTGMPNYSLDVEMLARQVLHIDETTKTEPLVSFLNSDGGIVPDFAPLKDNLAEVKEYLTRTIISACHPCRTRSMKHRDKGGVLD
jgi:hypothetical protein